MAEAILTGIKICVFSVKGVIACLRVCVSVPPGSASCFSLWGGGCFRGRTRVLPLKVDSRISLVLLRRFLQV